jgi:hypothetical protein
LQFLGSTVANLRDCVHELGFWSCEEVQGQQCILVHVHFNTSWTLAFLSGTGRVILPTCLPAEVGRLWATRGLYFAQRFAA